MTSPLARTSIIPVSSEPCTIAFYVGHGIIGKMLIGVTNEISAMCGAIDSSCDERVDKLVDHLIGKQILSWTLS
jgi:hypothetical protein